MCATTHNAATPIDHAGSPLVLLLFTVLPVGSCVGRSRARENASQNHISWHQGKHANKNPPETIHVECQCESGCARSNWPLRCPWHDPAAPILLTAHTSWNLPSFLQSLSLHRECCSVCKTPWQIKTGLHVKKWPHFQTTKRQHLLHLVCSPEALSESQPVILGTELHPDWCGAHPCLQGAAVPVLPLLGEDSASLTAPPLWGQLLRMWQVTCWQQSWKRCLGMVFYSPTAASALQFPSSAVLQALIPGLPTWLLHSITLQPSRHQGAHYYSPRFFRKPQQHQEGCLRTDTAPMLGYA